jgi:hypothetical protein
VRNPQLRKADHICTPRHLGHGFAHAGVERFKGLPSKFGPVPGLPDVGGAHQVHDERARLQSKTCRERYYPNLLYVAPSGYCSYCLRNRKPRPGQRRLSPRLFVPTVRSQELGVQRGT